MPIVGSRAGRDMDHGSRVPPVLGAVGGIVGLEFLHRVDGRLKRDLAISHIVQIDSVNHEIDGVFAVPCRVDGKRALPAQRRRQKTILRGSHGTRQQQAQIHKVPTVQGNLLHGALIDNLAYRHRSGIDHRSLGGDRNNFRSLRHFQSYVFQHDLADLQE